ncbi:MAG: hypothetical protein QNJ48_02340 [Desulfobacterales bacterium]|nr:hypothetical protein [Desulfobacterales bacterium]MDJ0882966.1 hypothetical protein [Desulfobacterales bacterium]
MTDRASFLSASMNCMVSAIRIFTSKAIGDVFAGKSKPRRLSMRSKPGGGYLGCRQITMALFTLKISTKRSMKKKLAADVGFE